MALYCRSTITLRETYFKKVVDFTKSIVTAKMWKLWLALTLLSATVTQNATATHAISKEPQYTWGHCPNDVGCSCLIAFPIETKLACRTDSPSIWITVCKITLEHPVDYPAVCPRSQ